MVVWSFKNWWIINANLLFTFLFNRYFTSFIPYWNCFEKLNIKNRIFLSPTFFVFHSIDMSKIVLKVTSTNCTVMSSWLWFEYIRLRFIFLNNLGFFNGFGLKLWRKLRILWLLFLFLRFSCNLFFLKDRSWCHIINKCFWNLQSFNQFFTFNFWKLFLHLHRFFKVKCWQFTASLPNIFIFSVCNSFFVHFW